MREARYVVVRKTGTRIVVTRRNFVRIGPRSLRGPLSLARIWAEGKFEAVGKGCLPLDHPHCSLCLVGDRAEAELEPSHSLLVARDFELALQVEIDLAVEEALEVVHIHQGTGTFDD